MNACASVVDSGVSALQIGWIFVRRCPDLVSTPFLVDMVQHVCSVALRPIRSGSSSAAQHASEIRWALAVLSSLAWASRHRMHNLMRFRRLYATRVPQYDVFDDNEDFKVECAQADRLWGVWSRTTLALLQHPCLNESPTANVSRLLLTVITDAIEFELVSPAALQVCVAHARTEPSTK